MRRLLQPPRVFVVVLSLGLFCMATRAVTDPDVWWHLRTGELIVQTHQVFHSDPFSFTRANAPWVNHEWLSEVLMYAIYRVGGWIGLSVIFGLVVAAAWLIAFLRCTLRPYVAGLLVVLGAFASAPSWGVRPQMFSFLLSSIFLFVLERAEERRRLLWWLPPLTLLWVNLHGGYAAGVALLVLFLLGTLLDVALGNSSWPDTKLYARSLILTLLGCVAVVPLNPIGQRMFWYPWQTLRSSGIQNYIAEWSSPNFHEVWYLPLLLLVLSLFAACSASPVRLRARPLLLLASTMGAALVSVRHIPLFALVAVPLLSRLLSPAKAPAGPRPLSSAKLVFSGLVLVGLAVFTVTRIKTVAASQAQAEAEHFPDAAVQFLALHRLPGPILNHYNWGGYIIWKLYPDYRVYLDGRTDLYGDAFMKQFAATYYVTEPDWDKPLKIWDIRTVLVPPESPLVAALNGRPGWRQVYADSQAVLLTRD